MDEQLKDQTQATEESSVEESKTDAESTAEVSANAEPKTEEKKASKEVSASLEKIIESIEKLSVLELADLVHALEDRFGVTAAAPMAVAAMPAAAADAAPAEEKTSFDVVLASAGANKIGVIKAVREILPTLGLKEAKAKLTAAGATVELK